MISYFSFSQTNVSGGIYSDTTWSPSGNPYIVTDNVVVFEDITLTIEPGVIIKFEYGLGIELRGKLIAIGNATDTITFTSNLVSPVQSSWSGITVIGTIGIENGQVTMEYCNGEYAATFIDLNLAYNGPYIFRHCYFANNFRTNYDGGSPSTLFENCTFESNYLGLGYCQFDSKVVNSSFINNVNGVEAIKIIDTCFFSGNTGVAVTPYGATINCTIQNNYIGVKGLFNSSNNIFINNTLKNNSIGVEIESYFNGLINFTGNTICNNTIYNIQLLGTNNADLSNNCWCSSDSTYIRSTIYDGYLNTSYGLINFLPFTTNCHELEINEITENNNSPALVFPNPFGNEIEIISVKNESTEIKIFDVSGRLIIDNKFINSNIINTEVLPKGVYFYHLETEKGYYKKGKLVKR